MGKRNQVTADLRISAEAQLTNSRSFISQLENIVDKFNIGDKMSKQLISAQDQLKAYNKILEKVHNKSLMSDNELKDLERAGDAIAALIAKTEKLYSGFSDSDWKKMSKAYLVQVEAQEKQILKIKDEYQKKTGKIYDKEIANYDKILAKNKQLKAQREQLAKTGIDDLATKQVEQLNQKLDAQKEKLQDIIALREKSEKAFQNAANKSAQSNGFSDYNALKNTKVLTENQVKRQLGTEKYNQEKQILNEVLRLIREIEQEETDINNQNTNAINIAKKYNLENVKDLTTLKEQYRIRKDILKTFTNDKGRLALQYETELNARLREQLRIKQAIDAADNAGLTAQNQILAGKYSSRQSLNASYTATNKSIANLQNQLTETGIETIVNTATTTVSGLLKQIDADIKVSNGELNDLDETNSKLATQSERSADEQDIKSVGIAINEHTDKDGENTRKQIQESHKKINALVNAGKETGAYGKEILQGAGTKGTVASITDMIPLMGDKITQSDMDARNKGLKLQSKFDSAYNEANRYMEMLETKMEPKEYQIVSEQASQELKEARKLVNEISSITKRNILEHKNAIETQREEMVIHDSQGRIRFDETGNPILKKGYTLEDYDALIDKNLDYEEALGRVNDIQNDYNVKITQAENAVHGLKQRSEEETKVKKENIQATEEQKKALEGATGSAQKTANAIHTAAEESRYLGSTFDDINNKVGYFLSMNYVFDLMTRKVREATTFTQELDKDMAQIGLVLGQTASATWKNFDTYAQMAERLNTTVSEVTAAMKLFYQQGLNTVEVNKMVEASAIAAALGESTMAEASETLTSIINSYSLSAEDAIAVTDKISQVAIASAADFGEISTAIEKVASSAASAGLDLDHMMGYLGKMIETTREAPTNIGTALKTIVANFTQFKEDPEGLEEIGSDINKVDTALRSVGISLTNSQGEVKDLGIVLDELGIIWDTLSRNQKSYLATQIAGTRQQSRFYALMNDYERTLELVNESSNSAGKANQQFALYQDSLTASTQKLNNEWEKFYNNILNNDKVLKNLKDIGSTILNIANNIGLIPTTIFGAGMIKGARKYWSELAKIKKETEEYNMSLLSSDNINKLASQNSMFDNYKFTRGNGKISAAANKGIGGKIAQSIFALKGGKEQAEELTNLNIVINSLAEGNEDLLKTNEGLVNSFLAEGQTVQNLTQEQKDNLVTKLKDKAATDANTLSHTASASAKWGEVAAQLALNAAIAIGIVAIGAIIGLIIKAANAEKERMTATAEYARELQNEFEETEQAYEDLKTSIDNYQSNLEALHRLAKGTEEWKNNVKELNNEVLELLKNYPELAKYININSDGAFVVSDEGLDTVQRAAQQKLSQAEIDSLNATQIANQTKIDYETSEILKESLNKYVTAGQLTNNKITSGYQYNLKSNGASIVSDASGNGYMLSETGLTKIINALKSNPGILSDGSEAQLKELLGIESDQMIETIKELRPKIVELTKAIDNNTETNALINQSKISALLETEGSEEYQTSDFKDEIDAILVQTEEEAKAKALETWNDANDDDVHNAYAAKKGYTEAFAIGQIGDATYLDREGNKKVISDEHARDYLAQEEANNKVVEKEAEITEAVHNLSSQLEKYGYDKKTVQALIRTQENGFYLNELSPEQIAQIQATLNNSDGSIITGTQAEVLGYTDVAGYQTALQEAINKYNGASYWNNQYNASKKNASSLQGTLNTLALGSESELEDNEISYLEALEQEYEELGAIKNRTSHEYLQVLRQIKEQQEENALIAANESQILAEQTLQEAQDKLQETQNKLLDENLTDEERNKLELQLTADMDAVDEALENLQEKKYEVQLAIDTDLKSDVTDAFDLASEFGALQDSLKENYEITFEEAQEIADRGFGAMLQNAKETSDQTIELDEDTVNAFIDGKQAQLRADKEEKIKQLENQKTLLQTSLDILSQEQAALTAATTAETEQDAQASLAKAMNYEAEYQAQRKTLEAQLQADDEANTDMDENAKKLYEALSEQYTTDSINQQNATDAADRASAQHANNVISYYKAMNNTVRQYAQQVKAAAEGQDLGGITIGSVGSGGININDTNQSELKTGYTASEKTIEDTLGDLIGGMEGDSNTRLNAIKQASAQLLKDVQNRINTVNSQIGQIDAGIAALKSADTSLDKWQGSKGGANDGGGGGDEFEPLVEKLEHFYNYLRQIEELEAKINKIREKRNLIDATQNYYIDDLKEENELLRQQSILYGNYIDDEKEYLAELRSALTSAYSDWVYFTNDGLVQVKQTEFSINSEEEEERYNAFSELLDEYQNEYNTMLENQNTLYSIQSTMVENINSMYDKMLQRLNDVTERLEYINSISEHKVTMNFGSIDKLPLLSEQIKTTTDMLLYADDAVKRLEGDFATLTDLVSGSAFKDLLTWDETLQKFMVNNAKMNSETQAHYEAQGYNWEDIVSWVESVAAASQKVTDSLQESNSQLMDAREALKDLLEERISTIDEIFEKATDEMNKFYGIYESKIESLGTENDLFGVKSENLEKQFEYLTQTATHAKVLLADLKENNQMVLNTLMQDYGQYVDMIDGVAYINKMAIEESDSLTESQRADLLQLYQLYYDSNDQIEELNEKFYDYVSQIEELEREKRDAIIDLKQQVHDELMRLDQEEIDDLSEKYAKMNALDNEYYSKLQQRINDARDARSRLQDQQNLTQMQNRLSVLQQDNSGQYNSELVELQRQINEQLQAQADTNVDLEMERIAREQQQREEDRQMQITQMENLLTFKDENGWYWQETQGIINEGSASVVGMLMNAQEVINSSQEQQYQTLEELQDKAATAAAELGQGGYVAENFRESLSEFVHTPLSALDVTLDDAAKQNADTIKNQIAEGTSVFINTMKGLFEYLAILTGKTTDKGYNTGNLSASGIYTMPTKEPPKPPVVTTPPPATNTSSGSGGTVGVGSRVKASSGARIYTSSTGSKGGSQYYANDPIYKVLQIIGNRALVRHHKLSSGYTGWFNLSDLTAYKKGGYVNFTGPAWVDGTNSSPEAFLNAKQTALFETLRDALVKMPNINSGDGETGDNITIENLTIDVKELADTDSIDKVVKTVKDSIYKDATSGNNMKINRRR